MKMLAQGACGVDELHTLIIRAQQQDLDAFGRLVQRFADMAYAIAYGMVGDPQLAEDVAQEAFVEAYVSLPRLREPAAFAVWFRRIVHKHGDRLTRHPCIVTLPFSAADELPSTLAEPSIVVERRELQQAVQRAIRTLPEAERVVITLFYLADYTQPAIAALLDLPLTTVKKRLYTARQRLKTHLNVVAQEHLFGLRPSRQADFARTVEFYIAVTIGDVARVRDLITANPALVHTREEWDAAASERYPFFVMLRGGFTPLHRAAMYGHGALIDVLLAAQADPNAPAGFGETPLHVAVLGGRPQIVARLLAAGVALDSAARNGTTPLHWGVSRGVADVVALLLEAGADPSLVDCHGRTPLDWARLKRNPQVLDLFRVIAPQERMGVYE
jgi:RNA polymerase sigma factor (sigma-70 family)